MPRCKGGRATAHNVFHVGKSSVRGAVRACEPARVGWHPTTRRPRPAQGPALLKSSVLDLAGTAAANDPPQASYPGAVPCDRAFSNIGVIHSLGDDTSLKPSLPAQALAFRIGRSRSARVPGAQPIARRPRPLLRQSLLSPRPSQPCIASQVLARAGLPMSLKIWL